MDSNLYLQLKKIKNNSCFVAVSKSGDTLETITNLRKVISKNLLKNRLVIITELKNSDLMQIGIKYNAEIIEHKEFISGRYSVLSESCMFPAALMGLNLYKFKNLKKFVKNKIFISSLIQNVSGIYTLNTEGIINSVIFNYDSCLNDLAYWYQQLSAESLGKKRKGIYPSISFGPKDHHSLLQLYLDGPKDKFFTFFNVSAKTTTQNKKINTITKAQSDAVKNIFNSKKIPFRQFTFSRKNESELGEIFTFLVLETILLSRLINVNPFDQPAVEEVKIETKRLLKR